MAEKEDLIALIESLKLPEIIKRDVIEHIDEIDANELLKVLEEYGAKIKIMTTKDKQAHRAYQEAVSRFVETQKSEDSFDTF